jgi:uncharacterized membrane protein
MPVSNPLMRSWEAPFLTRLAVGLLMVSLTGEPGSAGTDRPIAARSYKDDVKRLLDERCTSCHKSEIRKGGLDLSTLEGLLRGGDSGPAVLAGNAKASLLYKLVAHLQEPAMPYKTDKLREEEISLLAEWINAGVPSEPALAGQRAQGAQQVSVPIEGDTQVAAQAVGESNGKFFAEQVRSILEVQCFSCHGGKLKQAGLSVATREMLLRGSDNGPVIVPGDAASSLLVKKIKHEHQPGMPYRGKKLPEALISRIVDWIEAGAPYDAPLRLPALSQEGAERIGSDHWAFQVPKGPSVPVVKDRAWVRNPIDAFVAAEHEKRGLKPLPAADKRVLLRRVYLDLTGLPPTSAEMQAFLRDPAKDAYEKVVTQLLASRRYGERWGRHWMDIWRYSDWYGGANEIRNSQQYAWHWRDWIIDSLNQDKGYDRMLTEMLAGDEIAPTDPQVLRATGYLTRNWFRFNRNVWLQDTVEHTAAGFLGITLKCARCHDHKYDPIAQEEYYRFRAFFEPHDVRIDRVPGNPDLSGVRRMVSKPTRQPSDQKDGLPRVYDSEPKPAVNDEPFAPAIFAETYRFIRGDERSPDMDHPLAPGVPAVLGGDGLKIESVPLPLEAFYPDSREAVHKDLIAQTEAEIQRSEGNLAKAAQALAEIRQEVAGLGSAKGVMVRVAISTVAQAGRVESSPAISFAKEIKPIFERRCFSCHRANNERSGLNLETEETILLGGSLNGPAVFPRRSAESPLILYLQGEKKPRMPLTGEPLTEQEVTLIGRWIDQLPEDEPLVKLEKAEGSLALAEKELASARASLPALKSRIAAENAKYTTPPDPMAESLAATARKAERQAALLLAQENLFRAQQRLGEALRTPKSAASEDEKVREKRVAAARKQLEAAGTVLGQAMEGYTPIGKVYPNTSTGRRLALARWIASKQNPLTARVAINHIWNRHFGKGLVPTVINFGRNGKPPTHPELLDWLATELVDKNWSMKAIHRLIVTSNTYRMQSTLQVQSHANLFIDRENSYLWRMNARRMEGETVRDSMLHVSGHLDLTLGGPELEETLGEVSNRRSIYFRHSPNSQMLFLKLFDAANPMDCYERNESIVPQQALAMSNSQISYSEARRLARRLNGPGINLPTFVVEAFETVLGRSPTPQERLKSQDFVNQQTLLFRNPEKLTPFRAGKANPIPGATDPELRARENLIHVLFNSDEFVTIR